jgi:hypothetical protein
MTGAALVAPTGAQPQHMQALQRGNFVRLRRAEMRSEFVELGQREARDLAALLVTEPPEWLEGMLVSRFLLCIPRLGPHAVGRVLLRRRISEATRTLASLTLRQRLELAGALRATWGLE